MSVPVYLCVYVLVDMHACVWVWMYVEARGLCQDVFPRNFPPYFLKQALFLTLELIDSGKLTDQQAPVVDLSLTAQCWNYRCVPLFPAFYVGSRELNSGPHTCTESILPTGPSLQPLCLSVLKKGESRACFHPDKNNLGRGRN